MEDQPNHDLFACYYAVAFIDLLGQREAMRGLNRSLRRVLDATVKPRQSFPEPIKEVLDQMTAWELKHQRLSDGFVVFSSLARRDRFCPVVGVGSMLLACASLMLMSLAKGKPIHGGIDVGVGMKLYPGELYGPAVAKAYKLESSVAQYPRIVVGNSLRDYLVQGAQKAEEGIVDSFWKKSAESSLSFLGEDTDGHLIVDYLGEGVKAVFRDTIDEEILGRVEEFVWKQRETDRKAKNPKLVTRYLLLTEYLSSRSLLWFGQGDTEA